MTSRRCLLRAAGGAMAAAGLGACARMPAPEAGGTPAAQVSATGFAALYAHGMPRGAAVAFDDHHLLTCAHVLPAGDTVTLRRGADGAELRPQAVLRSARMDLAVLRVPAGFLLPPPRAAAAPEAGETVWAAGAPGLGSPVARGVVEAPDAEMPGFGRGFTAWMPALMGYSGGPVVDADGTLLGLTSALPGGGGAGLLALLTGADLDGLARRDRRVFVLSIRRAEAEAARLLG
ncbi:S1 family peptidase [Roseomonas haemaphysalidis]|uniref:Trypsin-like peptidase domain-containing protein n=1 Tax=Roseomonas haemaphysalidis TaxID=2768162 RepID=A0ABS3KMP3_9PROT|nr:serine protease [Roseomonas haemaphysalidis]MBO1077601.1 trypsin-like peptidase domain-containing protein [Roseomonas haemaphysalidis]